MMAQALQLLSSFRQRGIRFWIDPEGMPRLDPMEALDSQDRKALAECREGIIAILKEEKTEKKSFAALALAAAKAVKTPADTMEQLLEELAAGGFEVEVAADALWVRPKSRLSADMKGRIKRHKPAILKMLEPPEPLAERVCVGGQWCTVFGTNCRDLADNIAQAKKMAGVWERSEALSDMGKVRAGMQELEAEEE